MYSLEKFYTHCMQNFMHMVQQTLTLALQCAVLCVNDANQQTGKKNFISSLISQPAENAKNGTEVCSGKLSGGLRKGNL